MSGVDERAWPEGRVTVSYTAEGTIRLHFAGPPVCLRPEQARWLAERIMALLEEHDAVMERQP